MPIDCTNSASIEGQYTPQSEENTELIFLALRNLIC